MLEILVGALVVTLLLAVRISIRLSSKKRNLARQNGVRTEDFMRKRLHQNKVEAILRRRLSRLISLIFVISCLIVVNLFTDINVNIVLTSSKDSLSSADNVVVEVENIDDVEVDTVDVASYTEEEIAMSLSSDNRNNIDAFAKDFLLSNDVNVLKRADSVANLDNIDIAISELEGGWTRISVIGFEYSVVREYIEINNNTVYVHYIMPTNDWLELDMNRFTKPFLCYFESATYNYVKSDSASIGEYERIEHIISTRKEVK